MSMKQSCDIRLVAYVGKGPEQIGPPTWQFQAITDTHPATYGNGTSIAEALDELEAALEDRGVAPEVKP